MKDSVLIDRYTKSLFLIAKENKSVKTIHKSIKMVLDSLNELDDYKKLALSEQVPTKLKRQIWDAILSACATTDILKSFIRLLLENGRIQLFPKIVDKFNSLLLDSEGIKLVKVSTSFALSAAEKKDLTKHLEEICDKKVLLDAHVDKELLGGMVIHIDSFMLDASIKSKLTNIKTILLT
jgi:F-type H+-transporting ATPase subunit delta